MKCENCGKNINPIFLELIEISKRIDHFMGCINHGASFHDNKAIQDWNNGNFGIKTLMKTITCCNNPEIKKVN